MLSITAKSSRVEQGTVGVEGGHHDVRHEVAEVGLPRPHRGEPPVQRAAEVAEPGSSLEQNIDTVHANLAELAQEMRVKVCPLHPCLYHTLARSMTASVKDAEKRWG